MYNVIYEHSMYVSHIRIMGMVHSQVRHMAKHNVSIINEDMEAHIVKDDNNKFCLPNLSKRNMDAHIVKDDNNKFLLPNVSKRNSK